MSYYRTPPLRPSGSGVYLGLPSVTPVNRNIMIACGIVWACQVLLYATAHTDFPSYWLGIVPGQVLLQGWIWQPFTYMFLHSPNSLSHILLNMLMLWMIGGDLERHWGPRRYLTYYLVCGAGAGVFVTIAGWLAGTNQPTIGASGAIYGLLLAYGIIFSERILLFMMIFPMRARTMSWILFGIAFVSTWAQSASGVSHIAHLGGMVVGYLYLKRAWRLGEMFQSLRWWIRRRKFRVLPPRKDDDPWIH
jgi:membrane associated rhomboid family serine protease